MSMRQSLTDLLDPKHVSFDIFADPFVKEIWEQRYKAEDEKTIQDTFARVATAVMAQDIGVGRHLTDVYEALNLGLFMPAGRILSSAGLKTQSTLQNCYVSMTIPDTIEGIHKAYAEAMTTLGRYGGIGMDFSPIRPKGAKIGSQGLTSPGVVHWMQMWHDGSERVKQAGHRRGAMMGTLRDSHPDIMDFINAKHTQGSLTNFNVSILVSDGLMSAVKNDADWHLWHPAAPNNVENHRGTIDYGQGPVYVYQKIKARELWDAIMKSTYEYSEPGVIFIDKINAENNLWYCEDIRCTNPCGEQPLPPHGACNLGHINLARMVCDPFNNGAFINFNLIKATVRIAIRFLDNVIDVSNFPLLEQMQEQHDKRRIGLGVSGLADFLLQLGLAYDSKEAREITSHVMEVIAREAYRTSAALGKERGNFPLYDITKYGKKGFAHKICIEDTSPYLRNSLLLTVAPTGTVSIVFGNISSGIEPVFAYRTRRKVWISNDQYEEHINESFISRFYAHCTNDSHVFLEEKPYSRVANQLSPKAHVQMQAVVQAWIDASVTKTVNVPKNIAFEDFQHIYMDAYQSGCKGCTTYRPSEVRGSVIEDADSNFTVDGSKPSESFDFSEGIARPERPPGIYEATIESVKREDDNSITIKFVDNNEPYAHLKDQKLFNMDFAEVEKRVLAHHLKRPDVLMGCTYKIKWPHHQDNIYLTINEQDGQPYEVFIASMDLRNIEWMVSNCVMLSRCLRRGEDPIELAKLFQKIQGASEGAFIGEKYYTSLVAYIGRILENHFERYSLQDDVNRYAPSVETMGSERHKMSGSGNSGPAPSAEHPMATAPDVGAICPKCQAPALRKQEGCERCDSCGHEKCG